MKRAQGMIAVLAGLGVMLALASETSALPTFARKYRTSCTTCHIGFFKLNPFGEAFRQNGYAIPGGQEAKLVKEEPVALGAEAWKRVFPEAVWPGAIPSTVPVSFYAHQRIFLTENTSPPLNFKFPHEFKIFTGGLLGEPFSFWSEVDLESATTGTFSSGLKRVFFQANDLFTQESWGQFGWLPEDALNLRVGLIDIGVLAQPLNVRRTINKPLPYTYTVADSWDLGDLSSGLEANGVIMGRFKYNAGIVNGTTTGTPSGVFDENNRKDVYYRIAYKHGGLSVDGTEWAGTEGGELRQTDNWVDDAITVGHFGYWGVSTLTGPLHNHFRRLGLDARVNYGPLDLYSAFVFGRDNKASSTVRNLDTWSWFIEADYVLFPWLQPALRFEQVSYERAFSRDIDEVVASLLFWPRANIKLAVEGLIVFEDSDGNSQLLVDLTYAF